MKSSLTTEVTETEQTEVEDSPSSYNIFGVAFLVVAIISAFFHTLLFAFLEQFPTMAINYLSIFLLDLKQCLYDFTFVFLLIACLLLLVEMFKNISTNNISKSLLLMVTVLAALSSFNFLFHSRNDLLKDLKFLGLYLFFIFLFVILILIVKKAVKSKTKKIGG